jgi:hypothetical protein
MSYGPLWLRSKLSLQVFREYWKECPIVCISCDRPNEIKKGRVTCTVTAVYCELYVFQLHRALRNKYSFVVQNSSCKDLVQFGDSA